MEEKILKIHGMMKSFVTNETSGTKGRYSEYLDRCARLVDLDKEISELLAEEVDEDYLEARLTEIETEVEQVVRNS